MLYVQYYFEEYTTRVSSTIYSVRYSGTYYLVLRTLVQAVCSTTAFFSCCCPQLQLHLLPLPSPKSSVLFNFFPNLDSPCRYSLLSFFPSLLPSPPPFSSSFLPSSPHILLTRSCFPLAFAFVALAVNLRSCLYIYPFCHYYLSTFIFIFLDEASLRAQA